MHMSAIPQCGVSIDKRTCDREFSGFHRIPRTAGPFSVIYLSGNGAAGTSAPMFTQAPLFS